MCARWRGRMVARRVCFAFEAEMRDPARKEHQHKTRSGQQRQQRDCPSDQVEVVVARMREWAAGERAGFERLDAPPRRCLRRRRRRRQVDAASVGGAAVLQQHSISCICSCFNTQAHILPNTHQANTATQAIVLKKKKEKIGSLVLVAVIAVVVKVEHVGEAGRRRRERGRRRERRCKGC